jgi:hypothetical protein
MAAEMGTLSEEDLVKELHRERALPPELLEPT